MLLSSFTTHPPTPVLALWNSHGSAQHSHWSPITHSHLPTHQSAGPTFPLRGILCRHGHCPLLPGITATTKVTSTLSNLQCPKVPSSFRYALTTPFFYLELGSDYLRKHRSTVFFINIHHWRDLYAHLPPSGPFTSSIPLETTWPSLNLIQICSLSLHTDSVPLMLELFSYVSVIHLKVINF